MRYAKIFLATVLSAAMGLAIAAPQQAHAESATFDFAGLGLFDSNFVNVYSGLPDAPLQSVTATGGVLSQSVLFGLGVGPDGLIDPGQSVDFHFSPAVNVSTISLTAYLNIFGGNLGDNVKFGFSSNNGATWAYTTPTVIGIDPTYTLNTHIDANVTDFRVETSDLTDQFGIGSLSVAYTPNPTGGTALPVATPLPAATLSGFGSLSLIGLGTLARRRRVAMV